MGKYAKLAAKAALLKHTVKKLPIFIGGAVVAGKTLAADLRQPSKQEKGEITMKKSTFVSLIVFLSAVAGALGAAYLYLIKREKELDEYEQMLFSEEYEDDLSEAPEEDSEEAPKAAEPEADAPEQDAD